MLMTSFLTRDLFYHCIRISDSSCYLIGYLAQHGQSKQLYEKFAIFQNHTVVMHAIFACFTYLRLDSDKFHSDRHVKNKTEIPHGVHIQMACS